MSVSRAQLSLRVNRSADWQDRRCNRRDEEADAEVLSRILDIISDMPSYGYRRVWGIMRKQLRDEGLPPVNAKRVYRVMSEHKLLLLHNKPQRPQREHNGKIAVPTSAPRNTPVSWLEMAVLTSPLQAIPTSKVRLSPAPNRRWTTTKTS